MMDSTTAIALVFIGVLAFAVGFLAGVVKDLYIKLQDNRLRVEELEEMNRYYRERLARND